MSTPLWVTLGIFSFSEAILAEKAEIVQRFKNNGSLVAMAEVGINDPPALAYADVGIRTYQQRLRNTGRLERHASHPSTRTSGSGQRHSLPSLKRNLSFFDSIARVPFL